MKKKSPAIKDFHGRRVLIDTIAAYQDFGSRELKVHLRSGKTINLAWEYNNDKIKAITRLDSFLDFGKED